MLAVAIALAAGSGLFAQAGVSALDPAFRLPAGGRALAGPVLDAESSPPAAWLLSEDLSLYALTDSGKLAARIDLSAEGPGSLLALDPFGRVLVELGAKSSKAELAAYTRMGQAAWRSPIEAPAGAVASFAPAFGSDGRVFVLSGSSLRCFSPSGLRLWDLALPAAASCPPGVDGRGYPCVGLDDGSLVRATPYGEEESRTSLGSPALALCALPRPLSAAEPAGAAGAASTAGAAAGASGAGTIGAAPAINAAPTVNALGVTVPAMQPLLAASLEDGRVLFLGPGGRIVANYRSKAPTVAFAWDGATLYGLNRVGEAFAISIAPSVGAVVSAAQPAAPVTSAPAATAATVAPAAFAAAPAATATTATTSAPALAALWSTPTLCAKGALYLFGDRLVAVGVGRAVSLSLAGEVFRELSVPGGTGMPAISPAGLAYSSGSDWVLAAYRFEKRLGAPTSLELPAYPGLPDVASRELLFYPFASDPDRKLARLTDIHNSLRSGTIGYREPELAAYCSAVIEGSLDRELSETGRRGADSPLARARACELLGELGSVAYREPLFLAVRADPDPAVRAAACGALAAIQTDPDGTSMSAFLAAASRPVDERTALVIVDAIEGMTLRSGRAPSGDALRVLVRLTTRPYGQAVRGRAMAALGRISGASQ